MSMRLIKAYKLFVKLIKYFSRVNYLLVDNGISKLNNIILININPNFYKLYIG